MAIQWTLEATRRKFIGQNYAYGGYYVGNGWFGGTLDDAVRWGMRKDAQAELELTELQDNINPGDEVVIVRIDTKTGEVRRG